MLCFYCDIFIKLHCEQFYLQCKYELIQYISLWLFRFQCSCKFGDKIFGPVEARNKQTAKTLAAVQAIESLESDGSIKALMSIRKHRIATPAASASTSAANRNGNNAVLSQEGETEEINIWENNKV